MEFRKIKILIPFLLVHIFGVSGQTMMGPYWLYDNHYLTDKYMINPAFAGNKYFPRAFISTQRMDLQLHDAPAIHMAGLHGKLGIKRNYTNTYRSNDREARNAAGGLVFADNNGPFRVFGVKLDYAHTVALNQNSTSLSFGLGGMLFSKGMQLDQYMPASTTDPLIIESMGNKVMIPDFNAGIVLYHNQFYASFSVSQLLENSFRFSGFSYTPSQVYRNFYLLTGYRFVHNEFELETSIAAGRNFAPVSHGNLGNFVDVNVECFLKPVAFSLSYRINGYFTTSLLYRTPKLEMGVRAELFSTNGADARYSSIGLMVAYTFLPSTIRNATEISR